MFRKPIREIVAAFPAQESQLAGLRKTIEEICRQVNLPTKDINNLVLAIEEGATNIIRHAYLFREGEIRLKVGLYRHSIIFSLFDTGKSFQPPDKTKLDLKSMAASGRKGGLGFFLITKVMDRVEYYSLEGENELRMIKFLSPEGEKELSWSGGGSLRIKFSAWTMLIILILVAGGYIYIDTESTRYIRSRLDKTVGALSNTIASLAYSYTINRRSDAEFDEMVVSYQRANDVVTAIIVVDTMGLIVADSRDPARLLTPLEPELTRFLPLKSSQAYASLGQHRSLVIRKIDFRQTNLGTVIMEYSSAKMEEELQKTRFAIFIFTGIGLLIGIIGIYLLSNYFVRPIGRIVLRVRRFAQGDLESQLPLTGAGEFYEISRALNELIMRIRRDRKNIVEREILQKEMQMAEVIQRTLIPSRLPEIKGFQIGTIYKAARMVGGDLFDVVRIDDHTFGVVVADVSGKGVPGSLVMSVVRTAVRLEARGNPCARDILIRVNDFIAEDIKQGMFVTILLAVIDTDTGRINFASAGHNPVIHYVHQLKEAVLVNAPGMPVGIKPGLADFSASLGETGISLGPNDLFVIYTDGIVEGRGEGSTAYGTTRLVSLIKEHADASAPELSRIVEEDLTKFIGDGEQHDDITMVILKFQKQHESAHLGNASESATPHLYVPPISPAP